MKRVLKLLLICTMLALIPMRGLAAVTVGICAAGNAEWSQAQDDHDHAAHKHGTANDAHEDEKTHDCSACAEHCAGACFVAQATPHTVGHTAGAERALPGELFAAGHVPEHLDPPPLAL